MSEPREFWLCKNPGDELAGKCNDMHVYDNKPHWFEDEHGIHVIEHSAYDTAQAELKAAREEIKELREGLDDEKNISRKISYQQDAIQWKDEADKLREENARLAGEVKELSKTSPSGRMALQIGALKDERDALKAEVERLKTDPDAYILGQLLACVEEAENIIDGPIQTKAFRHWQSWVKKYRPQKEQNKNLRKENDRLRSQVKCLREALEFYSQVGVWGTDTPNRRTSVDPSDHENVLIETQDGDFWDDRGGKRARAALARADELLNEKETK